MKPNYGLAIVLAICFGLVFGYLTKPYFDVKRDAEQTVAEELGTGSHLVFVPCRGEDLWKVIKEYSNPGEELETARREGSGYWLLFKKKVAPPGPTTAPAAEKQ